MPEKAQRPTLWERDGSTTIPKQQTPNAAEIFDVVVVGAGITGLTTAWLLKQRGRSVAVLDAAETLGGGETLRTSAHLTDVLDVRVADLQSQYGDEQTRLILHAQRWALRLIEGLIRDVQIECGFERVPGYLMAETDAQREILDKEENAYRKLDLAFTRVAETPLPFAVRGALRVEDQAQFHPGQYLGGLARAILGSGVALLLGHRVHDVQEGEPCTVVGDGFSIKGVHVVVASGVPINNRFAIHTKLLPRRSYVLAGAVGSPLPGGLFWDLADPYHYLRTVNIAGNQILIVGGEDHRVGEVSEAAARFRSLERYVRERFGTLKPTEQWSGQIIETVDGLPYIGANVGASRVFVATGFSGNGLTQGTLAARLMLDAIEGQDTPMMQIFKATRLPPLSAAGKYLKGNLVTARHLVTDGVRTGAGDLQHMGRGTGCVMRWGTERLAIFRDDYGAFHALSPVCPHLGCQVGWNDAERTWDCPCHGSRFDATGYVLNGPASSDLEPLTLPTDEELFATMPVLPIVPY